MLNTQTRSALPFLVTGILAVIAGGMIAAGAAHAPTPAWVWASAYLVLVVGVAQCIFGIGQSHLATHVPSPRLVATEWTALNFGNAGIVVGTLGSEFTLVLAGTALFVLALGLFFTGVRHSSRRIVTALYRLALLLLLASALTGLFLSITKS